jgi:proteasome lid subunit RPN8/RPN11
VAQVTADLDPAPGWSDGVLASLYEVAFATPDREVAGVLVGTVGGPGQPPQVRAVIPAAQGLQPGQASQFTHQTWAYIHETMGRHYAGLEVMGWYLARPGMGTELLDPDVANHQRWFGSPGQILLALDSRAYRGALYQRHGTAMTRLHEGPVERRYTRPAREGRPAAALMLLTVLGIALGSLGFLLYQAFTAL